MVIRGISETQNDNKCRWYINGNDIEEKGKKTVKWRWDSEDDNGGERRREVFEILKCFISVSIL